MIIWTRIALVTALMISSGSATYATDHSSYIISSSRVPQLNPIKYEIAFVSRFDNRIIVDLGDPRVFKLADLMLTLGYLKG
jgi:hypothetical protein